MDSTTLSISALNGGSGALAALARDGGAAAGPSQTVGQTVEDRRALIQAVRLVNAAELYGGENELSFAFDRNSRRAVVRIVDRETRTVVQQIPTEQVLRLAEELKQQG